MQLMLPSARREEGGKQPCIKLWKFDIRLPFIHYEWEIPEMLQACVVFMTGTSATVYLQDLFGLSFYMALSIIFVHELLYMVNNTMGDPLIGGWITPAVPLITAFLLNFEGVERIWALTSMELVLGLMYVILGVTGIATKLIDICPQSLKAGILIGSGIAACIGPYGFKTVAAGGKGFFMYPISWSIGCAFGLFLLFSNGFDKVKFTSKNPIIKLLTKAGFVPSIILGGILAMIIGEVPLPDFSSVTSVFFNPLPGLGWVMGNFSILGVGINMGILVQTIPMAIMCYVIAFGDIVGGTAFLEDTKRYRTDEYIDVNPDRTNICCGIRNLIEAFFSPTCTMSGPLWSAMTVSVAERYKTGKENMYSIFGGSCTFNTTKWICQLILPLVCLIQPILPLAMAQTLMIQAFGCFYVGINMCRTNTERGVAGITASAIAICPNPSYGLFVGIILCIVMEIFNMNKKERRENIEEGIDIYLSSVHAELENEDAKQAAKAAKKAAK
ncbi:MAG: hypothetical protein HUJ67_01745 [Ruminiclostridium sp.]|nr:hypothetical protein [Ruminiclostridium sp.]